MSEESKSNTPATPAPIGEIEHGPSQFEQFLEKNLKKLILVAVLIVVGVAAYVVISQLGQAAKREAGNALLAAESPEDYRKVISDHAKTNAANSAQLLLAGQLWDEGKKEEAMNTLKSMAADGNSTAVSQAKFALASMLAKEGQSEEAQSHYEAILANPEVEYLHPLTLVALGDLAQAAGNEEIAKSFYQRKIDDYPLYADQNIATTRLNLVGIDEPKKVSPPPAPDPTTNPANGVSPTFTKPIPRPGTTPPDLVPPQTDSNPEETENEALETNQETPTLSPSGEAAPANQEEAPTPPASEEASPKGPATSEEN